jgi:hypothetical protein
VYSTTNAILCLRNAGGYFEDAMEQWLEEAPAILDLPTFHHNFSDFFWQEELLQQIDQQRKRERPTIKGREICRRRRAFFSEEKASKKEG